MANTETKTGPGLKPSLAIFLVGLLLAGLGGYKAYFEAFHELFAPQLPAPGSHSVDLDSGQYNVFVKSLDLDIFNLDQIEDVNERLNAASLDLTITNQTSNAEIELASNAGGFEHSTSRGFTFYESIGEFTLDSDGSFTVDLEADPAIELDVIVAESIDTAWKDAVPWAILGTIGIIALTVGLVMLVLGVMRRNKAAQAARRAAASEQSLHQPAPAAGPSQHNRPAAPANRPSSPPPPPPASTATPTTPSQQAPDF